MAMPFCESDAPALKLPVPVVPSDGCNDVFQCGLNCWIAFAWLAWVLYERNIPHASITLAAKWRSAPGDFCVPSFLVVAGNP